MHFKFKTLVFLTNTIYTAFFFNKMISNTYSNDAAFRRKEFFYGLSL